MSRSVRRRRWRHNLARPYARLTLEERRALAMKILKADFRQHVADVIHTESPLMRRLRRHA